MRAARKLALKKESLFELTTDELRDVAGGALTPGCPDLSRIINPCQLTHSPVCQTTTFVSKIIDPCITG